MSIYLENQAHVQVVIKCRYYVAQMCSGEDTLTHYLGLPFVDDKMRHNTLITNAKRGRRGLALAYHLKVLRRRGRGLNFPLNGVM